MAMRNVACPHAPSGIGRAGDVMQVDATCIAAQVAAMGSCKGLQVHWPAARPRGGAEGWARAERSLTHHPL